MDTALRKSRATTTCVTSFGDEESSRSIPALAKASVVFSFYSITKPQTKNRTPVWFSICEVLLYFIQVNQNPMKKTYIYIAVVLVIIVLWYLYQNTTSTPVPVFDYTNTDSSNNSEVIDPKNATFRFEDGDVALKNGKAVQDVAPGSAMKLETILTDTQAMGDINGDSKDDSVIVLVQSGAGTGVFFYLGAYVSGPLAYKGSNVAFVGDRISPQSISIQNGVITLNYLDRNADEPFDAEPTVSKSKTYSYSNETLEETD